MSARSRHRKSKIRRLKIKRDSDLLFVPSMNSFVLEQSKLWCASVNNYARLDILANAAMVKSLNTITGGRTNDASVISSDFARVNANFKALETELSGRPVVT